MWNWIKSKISVKSAAKLALQAAQKPAETALIAALATQGISLPALGAEAAVGALFAEIEKVI